MLQTKWKNGKCMSYTNNNNTRCTRDTKTDLDFCGYHKKSKKYYKPLLQQIRTAYIKKNKISSKTIKGLTTDLINFKKDNKTEEIVNKITNKVKTQTIKLNKNCIHKLFTLKDSWYEVSLEYRIKLDDGWWDLNFLVNHFTQQLNNTDMENPYPIFPSSPLTRKVYTCEDILKIKQRIIDVELSINIALRIFLTATNINILVWYEYCTKNNINFSNQLLDYLKKNLRFKTINNRDSQDCFTGYWISKTEPLSDFERLYKKYQNENFQLFNYEYNIFIFNQERENLYLQILISDKECWSVLDDDTTAYIK